MIILETERLTLRELTPDDESFIFTLLNEPSWLKYIGDRGIATPEDARIYIEKGPMAMYARHGFGLYLVALKLTQEPMGLCGLIKRDGLKDVDLGFAFLPAFWGKGYALEAATAVVDHGTNILGISPIVAITAQDNVRSGNLLEKLGFHFTGFTQLHPDAEVLKLYQYDA